MLRNFQDKVCITLSTAETLKLVREYDQEIQWSQTADKLKFKWQFSESHLTMKVSNASKTPGGTLIFFSYVGLGPPSGLHKKKKKKKKKNIRYFKHPKKIFEILATQKIIPHSVPWQ